MKKHLSVFQLMVRSNFYSVLGLLAGMVVLQTGLFWLALNRGVSTEGFGLGYVLEKSHIEMVFCGVFIAMNILRTSIGYASKGKPGYTMMRLSVTTHKNMEKISFATCEHSFFSGLSPKGHKEFYGEHFPKFSPKRFDSLMKFFELPMNKSLRSFSTGQKNQFEVILALSQGADYILMDEPFAGNDIFNREDFYKVLLGILEPNETVFLSTHLIEEVADFIGRAVLIHNGEIIGDVSVMELEEEGKDLVSYIKDTYHYRSDRVSRALEELAGEE